MEEPPAQETRGPELHAPARTVHLSRSAASGWPLESPPALTSAAKASPGSKGLSLQPWQGDEVRCAGALCITSQERETKLWVQGFHGDFLDPPPAYFFPPMTRLMSLAC